MQGLEFSNEAQLQQIYIDINHFALKNRRLQHLLTTANRLTGGAEDGIGLSKMHMAKSDLLNVDVIR